MTGSPCNTPPKAMPSASTGTASSSMTPTIPTTSSAAFGMYSGSDLGRSGRRRPSRKPAKILGVSELRDYYRKTGAGRFWDDHITALFQEPSRGPDLLAASVVPGRITRSGSTTTDSTKICSSRLLVNYVEPKIPGWRKAVSNPSGHTKPADGDTGKEVKRLAKEGERQEDFLSELRDFEDKLRRAANLRLEPDLNDGVVLNIAPLHELVPWQEAKKYWEELLEGKYEWSSIGKQLHEKGFVLMLDQPRPSRDVGPSSNLDVEFSRRVNILHGRQRPRENLYSRHRVVGVDRRLGGSARLAATRKKLAPPDRVSAGR